MDNHNNVLTKVTANQGEFVAMAGGNYRIVISGKQTGGAYAVIEMLVPPNSGPGPHAHPDFQESFHVLEGEVEVKTENETFVATQGSFINIPLGGLVHGFKNKTDSLARLWCVVVPAGLEEMFQELGEPVEQGEFLPPPTMDAAALQKMQAIAEKHGQKLYPPDYLDK